MLIKLRCAPILAALLLTASLSLACRPSTAPSGAPAPPPRTATAAPVATAPPSSPQQSEWDKVLATARSEGAVTLYTTFAPPELRSAMIRTIKEKYGIRLDWVVSAGATNAERIRTEQRAKAYVADVWWTGFSVLLTKELRNIGGLASFTPPVVIEEPGVWKGKGIYTITDKGDALAVTQTRGIFPVVNTKVLRPEEYPRSYKDLLAPKWKGQIVMHDPTVPGGGNIAFNIAVRDLGREYWERMTEQNIAFIRDYGEVGRRVATGEAAIALGLTPNQYISFLVANAPIRPISVAEGAYITSLPWYLVNHGPNPNAAKVLINWTLTKEGQSMISRLAGDEPIRNDVDIKYHPAVEAAVHATDKWLVDSWEVKEKLDQVVADGTARKLFGLK